MLNAACALETPASASKSLAWASSTFLLGDQPLFVQKLFRRSYMGEQRHGDLHVQHLPVLYGFPAQDRRTAAVAPANSAAQFRHSKTTSVCPSLTWFAHINVNFANISPPLRMDIYVWKGLNAPAIVSVFSIVPRCTWRDCRSDFNRKNLNPNPLPHSANDPTNAQPAASARVLKTIPNTILCFRVIAF